MPARHNILVINNSKSKQKIEINIKEEGNNNNIVWSKKPTIQGFNNKNKNKKDKTKKSLPVNFKESGVFKVIARNNADGTAEKIRKYTEDFPSQKEIAIYVGYSGNINIFVSLVD